jgi:hypothetical protein
VEIPNPFERLVASGGGPLNPARSAFFIPEADEYQPMQVDPSTGIVSGHIARDGQCHLTALKTGVCKTAPPSKSVPPFKAFHRTVAVCDDETEVACGWIAIDTKHAPQSDAWGAPQAQDHYDHTGTLVAKIRLSNGVHGIWASGVLLPGLSDRALSIMQGPEVSGDWRTWEDPDTHERFGLEVQAVLAVPDPAFPGARTRPELLVASNGEITAMFGQLDPDCDCLDDDDFAAIEAAEAEAALAAEPVDVDALEAEADAALLSLFDLRPLSAAEAASYFARYSADQKAEMAKDGKAMPDGSYPIDSPDDLDTAIRAANAPGAGDKVRRHVIRQANRVGLPQRIPPNWQADGSIRS